jgi:phospholipid/cholesterol/gamma-HCH transport system substrate-binding protein
MKEEYKASRLAFAVGFVIFLGITATVILLLGFGEGIFTSTYTVSSYFDYAGGVKKNSPVYMGGVAIGYVDHLVPPTAETPLVKIVMKIYKDISIREDSILTIESLGLIGEKYLEFSVGSKTAKTLPKDGTAVVKGYGTGGLQAVQKTVIETAEALKKTLKEITKFVSSRRFKYNVLRSFRTFSKFNLQGAELFKEFQTKLAQLDIKQINNASAELVNSLKKSQNTLEAFNNFIEETKKTIGQIQGIGEIITTTKSMVEKGNALLTKISQGEGTLGELFTNKDLYFSIKNSISRLDSEFNTLSTKLQNAASAFTDNMNEIKTLISDIKSAKGTLGKIAYNEEAYNKIIDTLNNINNTFENIRNTFNNIKQTSDNVNTFLADIKECPDAIAWGWEKTKCKSKYKTNADDTKKIKQERNR